MAEKSKNIKNQGLLISLCIAIIAVIVIIVFVIIMMINKNSGLVGLNDSYFSSDNSKLVLTADGSEVYIEKDLPIPNKYYLVYSYSGDEITGLKTYYLYDDAEQARTIYNYYLDHFKIYYDSVNLDGKYMILTITASEYEGITVDDVKQQIEVQNRQPQSEPTETEEIEETEEEETEPTEETPESEPEDNQTE